MFRKTHRREREQVIPCILLLACFYIYMRSYSVVFIYKVELKNENKGLFIELQGTYSFGDEKIKRGGWDNK